MVSFAYLNDGTIQHRGTFDTDLAPQRFAEEVAKLQPEIPGGIPVEEIRVWAGVDTSGTPDGVVVMETAR